MKRFIIAAVVAMFIAVPAVASANATTSYVAQQFSVQIHNRARLSGITVTSTTLRCAYDGRGYYSCYGTYTVYVRGMHAKYGIYVNITPRRWYTVGSGRLVSTW